MVKVKRSYPAPKSLEVESQKSNGNYNEPDVVERLREDFNDKCYICEVKGLQDPEVEHLLPHKNDAFHDRKFDWNNLFWCCGHCNSVKNAGKYDAGIIDCCKEDPEMMLLFSACEDDIRVEALDKDDKHAVLTAELIYETFNKKNTGIRIAACDNRIKLLNEEMNVLFRELENYNKERNSSYHKRRVACLLRRESPFAAFKRAYVRDRLSEYPEFENCVR